MKKLAFFLMTLIFTCSLSITAFATEPIYENIRELNEEWQRSGYPDYVYKIGSTDGTSDNLTITVTNTPEGNSGKRKILELIKDDSTVTFVYQEYYSEEQLEKIKGEVLDEMALNHIEGLFTINVNEWEQVVEVRIQEANRHDAAVVKMVNVFTTKYGNAIEFEFGNYQGSTLAEDPLYNNLGESSISVPYVFTIGAIFLLFFFLVIVKQRNSIALQTNTGKTVTTAATLTTKEVENMIKKSNLSVPADLDEKIMSVIKNT